MPVQRPGPRRRLAALVTTAVLGAGVYAGTQPAAQASPAPVPAPAFVPHAAPPATSTYDAIAEKMPTTGYEALPPADMTGWYAVPLLRERRGGAPVPAVEVLNLPALGLSLADLEALNVPAVPFAKLATLTNDVIREIGVAEWTLREAVPAAPGVPGVPGGASAQSIPPGSQLPVAVYYDQSTLDQWPYGRGTADDAWSQTVSLFQSQFAIPVQRVILLTGSSVPDSDVTTKCEMQTLAQYEMSFGSSARGLMIFSAGTIEGGTQGVTIDGKASDTFSRGESYNHCGDAAGFPRVTPATIPSMYSSSYLDAPIPTVTEGKNGAVYVAAHELGHFLAMEHNMARCWSSDWWHVHKTIEAFTSGSTRSECGDNANPNSHYHWKFNDNTTGPAGTNGYQAITAEWDRFANCRAAGWCATDATPSAVRSLSASANADGSVTLSWTAPLYAGSSPLVGYCWYKGTTSSFLTGTGWCPGSGTSTTIPASDFTPGQRTYFYVRAHNSSVGGQGGPRSNYASVVPLTPSSLTSTTPTSYPSSVTGGTSYSVCWSVNGAGAITHTDIHWGTTTSLGSFSPVQTGTAPQSFCTSLTAPSSGTIYLRSHATGPANSVTSGQVTIPVTSPNDCGTGVDAGGSHAAATSITLPKSGCTGSLGSPDAEDWYQFPVTSGQTVNASMTPNASADFDICLYNPSGSLVGACTTGATGTTDTLSQSMSVTGQWRLRVLIWSGTGPYTLSVSTASGGGVTTIRDDDNEKDADLRMNYNDDVAVKRLNVTSTQLSGKTTATLHVYGMTWGCPSSVGNKYRLRANGSSVADFNPCSRWSDAAFGWSSFSVPISYLTSGTNSFDFQWLTGDWTTGNVYLGVDGDTDFGRSDTSYDTTTLNGELMWYLVLS